MTQATQKKSVTLNIPGVPYEANCGLKYLAAMNRLSKEKFVAKILTEYTEQQLAGIIIDWQQKETLQCAAEGFLKMIRD